MLKCRPDDTPASPQEARKKVVEVDWDINRDSSECDALDSGRLCRELRLCNDTELLVKASGLARVFRKLRYVKPGRTSVRWSVA
jgi:hypothetical protein